MENSQRRTGGVSPLLIRSKSGTRGGILLVETQTFVYSGTSKGEEKSNTYTKKTEKKTAATAVGGGDGGFVRFLRRSKSKNEVPMRTRSASTSPSAWALSPGRSLPSSSPAAVPPVIPKSPASSEKSMKQGSRGGVSGVLKYLKQRRVSPVLEVEYHRFSVMYNRLLQWRFANARAEASIGTVNRVAQKKLFNGWVKISVMRNFIAENRIQILKLKHEIKLYEIFNSEMRLLNEWSRIDAKNAEAVGRVARKLSAVSVCLPLLHNAKADVIPLYNAMSTAMGVMDDVQSTIADMYWQAEETCFLLMELTVVLKQERQLSEELEKMINGMVESLEVQEKSLRVHCIQLVKEVKEIN